MLIQKQTCLLNVRGIKPLFHMNIYQEYYKQTIYVLRKVTNIPFMEQHPLPLQIKWFFPYCVHINYSAFYFFFFFFLLLFLLYLLLLLLIHLLLLRQLASHLLNSDDPPVIRSNVSISPLLLVLQNRQL